MDSSNLSVDKIFNSCVKNECIFSSSNMLSYKTVCDKEEIVNSSNLQSVLFKVLRKVYLSSLNVGLWKRKLVVDSISKLQLQIEFKQS